MADWMMDLGDGGGECFAVRLLCTLLLHMMISTADELADSARWLDARALSIESSRQTWTMTTSTSEEETRLGFDKLARVGSKEPNGTSLQILNKRTQSSLSLLADGKVTLTD